MPKSSNGVINRTISITCITDHPENYRFHGDEQMAVLKAGFERYKGQVRSAVVQATASPSLYYMVAGHGLKKALTEWGETEMRCDVLPASWGRDDVIGYMIHDNKSSQLAEDNTAALLALAREQIDAGYDYKSIGMGPVDLDKILASAAAAPVAGANEGEGGSADSASSGAATTADNAGEEPATVEITVDDLLNAPKRCNPGDVWRLGKHWLVCSMHVSDEDAYAAVMTAGTAKMVIVGIPDRFYMGYPHGYATAIKFFDDCKSITCFAPAMDTDKVDVWLERLMKSRPIYQVLIDSASLKGDNIVLLQAGPTAGMAMCAEMGRVLRMVEASPHNCDMALEFYARTHGEGGLRKIRSLFTGPEKTGEEAG